MVRLGLRKKDAAAGAAAAARPPPPPAPVAGDAMQDDDDYTSTTSSESEESGVGIMPHIPYGRAAYYNAPRDYDKMWEASQALQEQQQQQPLPIAAPPAADGWTPKNTPALLPDVLRGGGAHSPAPGAPWGAAAAPPAAPVPVPPAVATTAVAAAPAKLFLVPAGRSTALEKMRTEPALEASPLAAFGLTFRAAFTRGGGRVLCPTTARFGPMIDPAAAAGANAKAVGGATSAGGAAMHTVAGGMATAAGCLAVLAEHAAQRDAAAAQLEFDVLSAPAPGSAVPPMLRSKLLDDIATALRGGHAPAFAGASAGALDLDKIAGEEAECAVRLVKALWGNNDADDAVVPQQGKAAAFGAPQGPTAADGLPVAYEAVNRGRRMREWLRLSARRETADNAVIPLCMAGRRQEAAQRARKAGGAAAAALMIAARHAPRVRSLLAGLPDAQVTPATQVSQARDPASPAPPCDPPGWRWRERLQHALDLSVGGDAPDSTATAVRAFAAKTLATLRCPPPYCEELAGDAAASTPADLATQLTALGDARSDICWHLLVLWAQGAACSVWADGDAAADPTTHLCDPCTWTHRAGDVSLNWVVCTLLAAAPDAPIRIPAERMDLLAAGYADQLYNAGQWRWAVFVLLTITDAATRKAHVLRILTRHHADLARGAALLPSLPHVAVPQTWVAEAKELVTPPLPPQPQAVASPLPFASYFDTDAHVSKLMEGVYAA